MVKSSPVMQDSKEKPRPRVLSDAQIASLVAQAGCLVIVALFAFLAAGVGLDKVLHTRPLFTLLFVLGSMPLTLVALYRFAVGAVSKARQPPPGAAKGTDSDDDDA
jgi:hypothetical protein